MFKTVEGCFRSGKVELIEPAADVPEGRVLVTFLGAHEAPNLMERGIDQKRATDLRRRLGTIAEDWDRPEMEVYDRM